MRGRTYQLDFNTLLHCRSCLSLDVSGVLCFLVGSMVYNVVLRLLTVTTRFYSSLNVWSIHSTTAQVYHLFHKSIYNFVQRGVADKDRSIGICLPAKRWSASLQSHRKMPVFVLVVGVRVAIRFGNGVVRPPPLAVLCLPRHGRPRPAPPLLHRHRHLGKFFGRHFGAQKSPPQLI